MSSIPEALAELAAGHPIIVRDDASRENEGDLVAAADRITPEVSGFLVRHTSGYLCAPMTAQRADRLGLPLMVPDSEDPKRTAYTISCDAREGVTTGISAADRARTARALATGGASDLIRPGHVLPLIARPGGVRERGGHTEAAVELTRLAGCAPVGVIGEVVHDDGSLMRAEALAAFATAHHLAILTVADLVAYLEARPEAEEGAGERPDRPRNAGDPVELDRPLPDLSATDPVTIPTPHGRFTARAWRNPVTGAEHLSLTAAAPAGGAGGEAGGAGGKTGAAGGDLVRVHSECLTGDVFGSQRCDCGEQLHQALDRIAAEGGTLIYLRGHEGRGIGLYDKMRSYALQDAGRDTVDANLDLGLPADARDYGDAAAILTALGLTSIRLLTNNPAKADSLRGHGIEVRLRVPDETVPTSANLRYLTTKRDRMHHALHL